MYNNMLLNMHILQQSIVCGKTTDCKHEELEIGLEFQYEGFLIARCHHCIPDQPSTVVEYYTMKLCTKTRVIGYIMESLCHTPVMGMKCTCQLVYDDWQFINPVF